jgi:hypothetical protein
MTIVDISFSRERQNVLKKINGTDRTLDGRIYLQLLSDILY